MAADPRDWGIAERYTDQLGEEVAAAPGTVERLLAAMAASGAPPEPSTVVVRQGSTAGLGGPHDLTTEDGAVLRVEALPADLAPGYHHLQDLAGERSRRLIVSPGVCPLDPRLREWGWAVQLYSVRSRASWGVGDLADLRRLAAWSASLGAGMVLVNPLHAPLPVKPQQASPYYPSSRRFRNPLYIRVEEVPGADAIGEDLARAARRGRALNRRALIERDRVHDLKMAALDAIWRTGRGRNGFPAYLREQGDALEAYATFCAMTEVQGLPWREWPPELRHPQAPGVARFRSRHRERVRFHQWLQWLVDSQLATASKDLPVIHDLAVGVDPGGADSWLWQDSIAQGISVGAPPDRFNARGQDWGLPPFDPWRLREAGYEPFIQTLRSAFRHAGGLRIDHVMGLFRLFWIPYGLSPAEGAYVAYPAADLLDILALEATRASAYVVGEDLGTVEPGTREALAERNVLSYRLFWFEDTPTRDYPRKALAAVTTHDLPTVAGLWTGSDYRAQLDIGLATPPEAESALRERLVRFAGAAPEDPAGVVVEKVYSALGEAPSALLSATLEDLLEVEAKPNMPGTTGEWPNWSIPLPSALEQIEADPRARRMAERMRREAPS